MPKILANRAARDGIILIVGGLLLWGVAHFYDLGDHIISYLEAHEQYEVDEIVLAIHISGLFGFIYAYRRLLDQRCEARARLKAEADTVWISQHDALTRLPNRRMVDLFVAEAQRSPFGDESYVVYAIDLRRFKQVNERDGHEGGNALLVELANRLRNLFPDALAARLGADEFIVIARRTPHDLMETGQWLARAIERPFEFASTTVQIGADIGIARYPEDGETLSHTLRFAEMALDVAKKGPRSSVRLFDPSMDEEQALRVRAEAALRAAIDNGEIVPWYQPQIDLATGEVVAFEALARWIKPDGEVVPPDTFIDLAERTGLINLITERLLRQSCRDAADWPEQISLAFNISPVQLSDRVLPMRLYRLLAEAGLPATRLEIEITESAVMDDIESALQIIDSLHSSGIRVALDDFGTGYSSLAQLSRLPIDKLKIDRSFISEMTGDSKQAKIVKAMIGLGHGLGIVTTAEGIEHEDEWEQLGLMGCTYGQGYLFSRAIPAEAVTPWLIDFQVEQSLAHAG